MSANLISIKSYLGKYYPELLYSSVQDKYKDSRLEDFFEQRFNIQSNKVQMVVDPAMPGLSIIVLGNEIYISKELYDHPNVIVINSMENAPLANPRSLYTPETFSTVAYLICQNHTTLQIVGDIDEPIYVKYKSDYETFYNSVLVFDITNEVNIEIVEEIESCCALNSVVNYLLHPHSSLKLTTFYQNRISALSYFYRSIIGRDGSNFEHIVLGKGSSNVIDETKFFPFENSKAEFLGVVNSGGRNFHSILTIEPQTSNYKVNVDYREILSGKSSVTFFPLIIGQNAINNEASISVTNVIVEELPADRVKDELNLYVSDIISRTILERMTGVKRFYDNKTKFTHFP